MSDIGDAAAALGSAAAEAEGAGRSLAGVRQSLESARSLLREAMEGSSREEAGAALLGLDAALVALSNAETLLGSATMSLRTYVAEALGVVSAPVTAERAAAEPAPGVPQGLPHADRAVIRIAKLTRFSMDPGNTGNDGKWKAWGSLGYDVHRDREAAADDVVRQLRQHLPAARPYQRRETPYGTRLRTRTEIVGPNGNRGTLVTVWQIEGEEQVPNMITNWLEVHR